MSNSLTLSELQHLWLREGGKEGGGSPCNPKKARVHCQILSTGAQLQKNMSDFVVGHQHAALEVKGRSLSPHCATFVQLQSSPKSSGNQRRYNRVVQGVQIKEQRKSENKL